MKKVARITKQDILGIKPGKFEIFLLESAKAVRSDRARLATDPAKRLKRHRKITALRTRAANFVACRTVMTVKVNSVGDPSKNEAKFVRPESL